MPVPALVQRALSPSSTSGPPRVRGTRSSSPIGVAQPQAAELALDADEVPGHQLGPGSAPAAAGTPSASSSDGYSEASPSPIR